MLKQFINKNAITLLLALVVITMPIKSNINSMSIILLLAYSLWFLYSKRKIIVWTPSRDVVFLILPFIFILLQGLYSELDSFLTNLVRSLPIILFPFLFFYLKPWIGFRQIKIVLTTLVCSATAYSLVLLGVAFYRQIQYKPDFSTINWYFFTYYDFTEFLDIHPTYLGMYVCLAIAVVLYQFLNSGKSAFINILLVAFLAFIVFLSGSRIALVCLILIVLTLLIPKLKSLDRKRKLLFFVLSMSLPILVFNFVPIVKERMIDMTFGLKDTYQYAKYGDQGKDNNYAGGLTPRFQIWSCAVEVGNHNYLFGSGFGKTQKLLNECYIGKNLNEFAIQDYQTHSQYFNHYARGGFLGLFVLLLFYFYSLFYALKRRHLMHLSLIIIVIVTSLTENILNLHMGIIFFTFFNSLFCFSTYMKEI